MNNFIENTEMRIIPALISLCMFIWFVIPFTRGIVNAGNCTGAAISGILVLIFIFFRRFSGIIERMWNTLVGKVVLISVFSAVALCVIAAITISFFMIGAMNDRPDSDSTTLVVLGCQVKNGRPSNMLKRRLDAAYEYLSEHNSSVVVVSGGQGDDELISEAQCMKEYLTSRGIASERIYMEDKSTNTEENIKFSLELIRQMDLNENITIVTDGFHQLRADLTANRLGVDARNISASTRWYLLPTYWVREWFGNAYYLLSE